MKSKNPKIQTILKKGIVVLMSAMLTLTPIVQATSSLDDSYLDSSWLDKLLYGSVGSTAKEIEEYFKSHTTLYITNETQLRALAEYVNNGNDCNGKEIVLLNDIEIDSSIEWIPIGTTYDSPFKGTFDGNGFSISGLKYLKEGKTQEELINVGLFGISYGNIKNLTINNFNIDLLWDEDDLKFDEEYNEGMVTTIQYSIGNLVGSNYGTVENCINNSNIRGGRIVGGLVGTSTGTIINCKNTADIDGFYEVGGIVGEIPSLKDGATHSLGKVENCTNEGNVHAAYVEAGGIVGSVSSNGKINNCTNTGDVFTSKDEPSKHVVKVLGTNVEMQHGRVGGIVGYLEDSNINNCINKGEVYGYNAIGGIVGYTKVSKSQWNDISYNKNEGNISGNNYIGGIIGKSVNTTIGHSINNAEILGNDNVGGIAGEFISSQVSHTSNINKVKGHNKIGGIVGYSEESVVRNVSNTISFKSDNNNCILGNNNVGGIIGEAISTTVKYNINRSAIRGCEAVGGIVGYGKSLAVENSYNADAISDVFTGPINTRDIYGKMRVGGIIGKSESSNVKECVNVGELCGYVGYVGGITGYNYNTNITDCVVFQGIYTDYKNYTVEGGMFKYNNNDNIVESEYSSSSISAPVGAGLIVGHINNKYSEDSVVSISGCLVGTGVYGSEKVGGIIGNIAGNKGTVNCNNISRSEYLHNINSYIYNQETKELDIKQYNVDEQLYGSIEDDTKGSRITEYNNHIVLFEELEYAGVQLGIVTEDTTVYHVVGTGISPTYPNAIVNIDDADVSIGFGDSQSIVGYVETNNNIIAKDSNGTEVEFIISGGNEKNGIRYFKAGETITVNASFNKYLVTAYESLNPINIDEAPILRLNNSIVMAADNTDVNNYKTTVTYTYIVKSDESFDIESINVSNSTNNVYVTDVDGNYKLLGNLEASVSDVKVDAVTPGLNTNIYVENALETNRYTTGKDIIIEVTTDERIDGDYNRPEIKVKFSESGEGKYNYSEKENTVGFAKCIDAKLNIDGTTTWKYIYQIQEGDEGEFEINFVSGEIKDVAGNVSNVATQYTAQEKSDIYADTTAPTITITTDRTNPTNTDLIIYTFKFSEVVEGFTVEDITVNNGTKGNFVKNTDGTYTLEVTPTVAAGNEGYVQVIVEQNACQDLVALGNVRTENIIKVDRIAPIFVGLESYAESTISLDSNVDTVKQYYKTGDIVKIVATFTENIESSEVPTLNLQFSESGNAKKEVTLESKTANKITYTYTITDEDSGVLSVKGFSGIVKDIAGNETRVTKRALDGDTIIADTRVPNLNELKVVSPNSGVYKAGETIKIEAIYDEEIYALENNVIKLISSDNAPVLKLKFGNGADRTATAVGYGITDGKEDRTKIEYKYTIVDGDNGILKLTSYTGKTVCDIAGNVVTLGVNQTGNEITADTIRPRVTNIAAKVEDSLIKGINGDPSNTQTGYYKVWNEVKIILTFSEPVSGAVIMPEILVGFSENPDAEPAKYNTYAYESDWNVNSTTIEYSYTIKDGDNGYLWVKVPENQFADEAGNGNVEKSATKLVNIFADTTKPTVTLTRDTEVEQNNQTIIIKAEFSENVYDLNGDTRVTLTKENAPKLIYSFGTGENKEASASNVNGAVITYTINKDPVNDNGTLLYELAKGNLCDRAGNLYYEETTDTTAPVLESVVISTNAGSKYDPYCKVGTEIYVTATFDEPIAAENINLKAKVGEKEISQLNGKIVNEYPYQVKFTYTVKTGDMGVFQILDVCGNTDNTITEENTDKTYGWVKDEYGNQNNIYSFADEGVTVSGRAEADTKDPYITNIRVNSNGKEIATYTKEEGKDAVITVGRTNGNIVEYIVTYSEKVPYSHFENISITNGIIRDIEYTNSSLNEYKVTVQTTVEGVQSLIINEGTVEDKAGNFDGFVRIDAVTTDFTKPTVRFISEYNGGVYVLPTNIDKVEIRPNVEISEDIAKIEYKWDDGEYVEIENYSSSSDIAVPTKAFTEDGQYKLFIRVEDLAGNVYETSKTYIVRNSYIDIESNNTDYTNQDLTITVSFGEGLTDNRKVMFREDGSNESIELNASGTNEKGTEYSISTNGIIYAEATDRVGNKVFTDYTIGNIDKEDPEIAIELNGANLVIGTGEDVATIKTNVEISDNNWVEDAKYAFLQENLDIDNITSEEKEKISNNLNYEVKIENAKSGTYYLYVLAEDPAGNVTIVKSNPFTVVDTNDRKTTETVEGENGPVEQEKIIPAEKPVNELIKFEQVQEDVKDRAYVNVDYDYSIIKDLYITLADETYGFVDEYNSVELYGNTTIKVEAWDACGNRVYNEYKVTDIEGPEFTIFDNPEDWTKNDVTLEIYSNSELKAVTINDKNITLNNDKNSATEKITQYGNYTVKVTDIYNNTSEKTVEVKIDKSAPEITDIKVENGEIIITANDIDKTLNKELSGIAGYAITDTTEVPLEWSTSNEINVTKDANFFVWVKDNAGNIYMKEQIVIRDITAPEITITTTPELGNWVNTNINITVEANEELSSLVIKEQTEEDDGTNILTTKAHEIAASGTYTITAKDMSGNETVEEIVAKIDKDLPEITNVVVEGKEITITASDDGSGIKGYAITNTTEVPVEWDNSNVIKTTKDGTFYVWVKDNAGNIERKEEVIVVDTIPLKIEVNGNTEKWTNEDIELVVEANKELSVLTMNGTDLIEENNRITISVNGQYTFEAVDIHGKTDSVVVNVTKIDKDLPKITNVVVEGKGITITATDDSSGIAEYAITSTTEVPVEWSKSNVIKVTEDGIFYVWAIDKAGNIRVDDEVVVVDTTAPAITFSYLSQTVTVGMPLEANISTDENAIISYSWDKENWVNSETLISRLTISEKTTTPGKYTLYVKAIDETGNESGIQVLEFTVSNIEEIKQPDIIFEDIPTIQVNGARYVKVSSKSTPQLLIDSMNKEALCGKTPEYINLTEDNKFKTGTEITINGQTKYIVIVNGDVDCDGKVTFLGDVVMANNCRIGQIGLTTIQKLAADINNNGVIEFIPDIVAINNYRLGIINSL